MTSQKIPRSTAAARAHGPTRARRAPGDLQGPPQGVPRQVRIVTLRVEQLPEGRWRFTMPRAPGWAAAATTPGEVTASIRRAFTEAQVSAYSDWRGHLYDEDVPRHRRHRPASRGRRRGDVYDATEWRMSFDGRWIAPRGNKYAEHTQAVQKVIRQRLAMGLPPRPDPVAADYVKPRTRTVQRRDWAGSLVAIKPGQPVRLARPATERSSA